MSTHLVVPAEVGWTSHNGLDGDTRVYVARLPRGPVSVLAGTAAIVWTAALDAPEATLVERVAAEVDVAEDLVREDVLGFVDDLIGRGLLVRDRPTHSQDGANSEAQ